MGRSLESIAARLRFSDWGPGKIPVFCTLLAFIGLTGGNWTRPFPVEFALFLLYASAHSALGYVANDLGDREIDRAQGKNNVFETMSSGGGRLFFGALLLASFLSGLPFVRRPFFLPLWAGWAFFALAYSLPPLRLKERGAWGLGFSALAQWTLPVFLTFAALGRFRGWEMIVLVVAGSISGAALEVAHQRYDRIRDRGTRTATLGARFDDEKMDRLYRVMILLDKAAIGLVTLTVALNLLPAGRLFASRLPGGFLLLVYFVLLAASLAELALFRSRAGVSDPYYTPDRSAATLLHQTLPNLILPAFLLALLTFLQPVNLVLLLGFLYWRIVMGQADWTWPWRLLWKKSIG
jgi:4-hydroxybenzoate polyprenyltransferase